MNRHERVVVITGAARGIGEALTRELISANQCVAALDRSWDTGSDFYRELAAGERSVPLSCDIGNLAEVHAARDAALARFGRVDVLVNNAAMRQRDLYPGDGAAGVLDVASDEWARMFQVNVIHQVDVIKAFVKPMIDAGTGHVVNVSSRGGLPYVGTDGQWEIGRHLKLNQPYDACKAAFTNLSFYLAEELRPFGIAVNVVFPGAVRTTGADELEAGRRKRGIAVALGDPRETLPVLMALVDADPKKVTGRAFDAVAFHAAPVIRHV